VCVFFCCAVEAKLKSGNLSKCIYIVLYAASNILLRVSDDVADKYSDFFVNWYMLRLVIVK